MLTSRERWFAGVLIAGLQTGVLVEPEILVHVTPAVLAKSMPRDVLVKMFDSALTAGMLSPEAIVQTVTPELIAEFVSAELVWECIVAAAERADIVKGTDEPGPRDWLRRTIESALRSKVLTPAHLVRHADAKVLVNHLPDDLTAQLIESGLAAGRMTPELILDILGVEPIAAHAPTNIVWECIAEAGEGLLAREDDSRAHKVAVVVPPKDTTVKLASKPKVVMDYMDDDMVQLQVSVDDPADAPMSASSDTTKRSPVAES